ncbi:hypothetical protein RYH73_11835 [Olivibacter sp. CPCC 100613]|uniref:hypothetical protein n=1 Tax=Olivibacter sp. CPCC 100613 TaxID=3079931 RepID=UPI002FF6AE56
MKQTSFILLLSSIYFFFYTDFVSARQRYSLDNFIIKENLIKNNKLAIIACDSLEEPTDKLNGTFLFVINGFKQQLNFSQGVAISPQEIDKSSFVFLKHKNEHGTHSKLYYVMKNDDGLKPIKVNWVFLLLIPLAIIFIATIYKRLILLAIIALLAFAYFNYNKGLSFESIFETISAGIKSFF